MRPRSLENIRLKLICKESRRCRKGHHAATPAEYHNMSALTELEDPDYLVHAAWLAQVSKAADRLPAKPIPEEGGGSLSTSSLEPANHLDERSRRAPER